MGIEVKIAIFLIWSVKAIMSVCSGLKTAEKNLKKQDVRHGIIKILDTDRITVAKVNLPFHELVLLGSLCNSITNPVFDFLTIS